MKRILSLILLVGSFACGMEPDQGPAPKEKQSISSDENWFEQLEQKDDSEVPSLVTLCAEKVAKQFGNMSLEKFLAANQPVLPHELDSLVGSQILKQNPEIIASILQQIKIPCIKTLTGHNDEVHYIALINDNTIFSCSGDGTVKIWDIKTGKCLQTLNGYNHWVNSIALTNDKVVSCSGDGTIKTRDKNTGQCLQTFTDDPDHSDMNDIVITLINDNTIASFASNETIKIWDINAGQCLETLTYINDCDYVYSINLTNNTTAYGSIDDDGTIKIWSNSQYLQTLTGHTGWVRSLVLNNDGKTLFSCSDDKTIKIWDLTQFNATSDFINNDITSKQAILLKDWHTAKQNNQSIDLSNPQIQKVFDSLPEEIKKNIKFKKTK